MARIKVKDLPKEMKITKAELKRVKGGLFDVFYPSDYWKVDLENFRFSAPELSILRYRRN